LPIRSLKMIAPSRGMAVDMSRASLARRQITLEHLWVDLWVGPLPKFFLSLFRSQSAMDQQGKTNEIKKVRPALGEAGRSRTRSGDGEGT
jgi:hypothetical protein